MDNEKETNKNKKVKLSTVVIVLVLVAVVGGGLWWTLIGSKPQGPALVESDKEPITQESFEELPVGLIYEFSEEEQQEFLELAKKNYEEYGDKAPDMWGVFNSDEFFYEERWGITRKNNTIPTEMLNEDGSLRYPDGFYGFVVSNRDYNLQAQENVRQNYELITDADINAKVNQMLNVEQYYLVQNNGVGGAYSENGKALSLDYGTDWDRFLYDYLTPNEEGDGDKTSMGMLMNDTVRNLLKRAVDSGLLNAENINTNKIFELMYAPQFYFDAYELADEFRIGEHGLYKLVENMEGIPSAYNVINDIPDENVSYYFPTKVWKIDNNTIVVDVQIENGDMLGAIEIQEIYAKIAQSNTTETLNYYGNVTELNDSSYVVYTRLFNSDLTQGVMPDYGVGIANYTLADGWELGSNYGNYSPGYLYAYNDTAKNVLRYYYSQVKSLMESGDAISSQRILESAAEQYDISYHDAVNIWGTYYISHVYELGYYTLVQNSFY